MVSLSQLSVRALIMLSVQFKVDNVPFLFIHIAKVGKMLRIFNNGNKKILQSLAGIKY